MTFEDIKTTEETYLMHTYGRNQIALEKGQGATLWDVNGKKYIDLTSGIGVNSVGHNNEALVSALHAQAGKLMHASNLFYTAPMVEVAKELVTSTGMGKVFFANSGAEANEGMIKLARKYSFDKYGEGRNKIITLQMSFHGRTGSLFCYEQYGVQPDIVSMAKGLGGGVPIGAVLADKKCADVLGPGTHGTTFGGNPFCCTAAKTVLSIVNTPEFLKEVQEKGKYLKKEILAIGSDKIKTVRGMGLMLGIVVDKDERAALVAKLIEKGVLVLTAGTEAIRLLPPLVITYEEMDEALAVMKEVF